MAPETRAEAQDRSPSWLDLPAELLDSVIDYLPYFNDCARFPEVCRQWRAAWFQHTFAPMPWITLPGHCINLHDAAIHRVGLPEGKPAVVCRGSLDHWLALVPKHGPPYSPFLLNPFTKATASLPAWTKDRPLHKIAMSVAPGTGSCLVVAIVVDSNKLTRRTIAVCRPGQSAWSSIKVEFHIEDAIFYEGNLYALDEWGQLYNIAIHGVDGHGGDDREQRLTEQEVQFAAAKDEDKAKARRSLVACDGRLFMVNSAWGHRFSVYALERADPTELNRWAPVTSLDGRVLVIGVACCRAFAVPSDAVKDSQIYFVDDEPKYEINRGLTIPFKNPFRRIEVYDMRRKRRRFLYFWTME